MRRYYKDFYGCNATISKTRDGRYRLWMGNATFGQTRIYNTFRAARIAMGRMSDGWKEV